jgi:hypothetical protein
MVPHDQQLDVSSPGMINDDLDSVFAIQKFWAGAQPAHSPNVWRRVFGPA